MSAVFDKRARHENSGPFDSMSDGFAETLLCGIASYVAACAPRPWLRAAHTALYKHGRSLMRGEPSESATRQSFVVISNAMLIQDRRPLFVRVARRFHGRRPDDEGARP